MTAHTPITRPKRISAPSALDTPSGAVFVGTGSKWASRYSSDPSPASHRVNLYRCQMFSGRKQRERMEIRRELAGKDLAVDDGPFEQSHADVLLEIANGKE